MVVKTVFDFSSPCSCSYRFDFISSLFQSVYIYISYHPPPSLSLSLSDKSFGKSVPRLSKWNNRTRQAFSLDIYIRPFLSTVNRMETKVPADNTIRRINRPPSRLLFGYLQLEHSLAIAGHEGP